MSIFVQHNGQQLGPFTEAQLKDQLASGAISAQDHVWWEGQADWVLLSQTQFTGTLPTSVPILHGAPPAFGTGAVTTSKLAIWALVCGCLGIFFSLFASIPAIILGHLGVKETRNNPAKQGYGMALAGLILGYAFTVILPLISIIAISVLIALGNQVKETFKTIDVQTNSSEQSTPPNSTNGAPGGK